MHDALQARPEVDLGGEMPGEPDARGSPGGKGAISAFKRALPGCARTHVSTSSSTTPSTSAAHNRGGRLSIDFLHPCCDIERMALALRRSLEKR